MTKVCNHSIGFLLLYLYIFCKYFPGSGRELTSVAKLKLSRKIMASVILFCEKQTLNACPLFHCTTFWCLRYFYACVCGSAVMLATANWDGCCGSLYCTLWGIWKCLKITSRSVPYWDIFVGHVRSLSFDSLRVTCVSLLKLSGNSIKGQSWYGSSLYKTLRRGTNSQNGEMSCKNPNQEKHSFADG